MNKLTEFLIRCRMTGMVSNQIMLKIIKISINSANLETEAGEFLKELGVTKNIISFYYY
jgi:hypothetical protein